MVEAQTSLGISFSRSERARILAAALLAWGCAGIELGIGPLTARPAAMALATQSAGGESEAGAYFAYFIAAFLLGGALGGWIFGQWADQFGRVQALGWSVICFSAWTACNGLAQTPEQLCALRFLASLGIGGTWASAAPLLSEAWPDVSRPTVAGLLGSAGNGGIFAIALVAVWFRITPESWKLVTLLGGLPIVVGLGILLFTPESLQWRRAKAAMSRSNSALVEVVTPPLLKRTFVGVILGTVPLLGTWSASKWIIPWAETRGVSDEFTYAVWAGGATLGSLIGGWCAQLTGRRTTYFVVSLATLVINQWIYRALVPTDAAFIPSVFCLGLVATIFFGWLPLYLPELFPTHARASGAGVTYNSGRILSAVGVLYAGTLMHATNGDYPRVGSIMAWVYLVGMIAIFFAPDTTRDVHRGESAR